MTSAPVPSGTARPALSLMFSLQESQDLAQAKEQVSSLQNPSREGPSAWMTARSGLATNPECGPALGLPSPREWPSPGHELLGAWSESIPEAKNSVEKELIDEPLVWEAGRCRWSRVRV